MTNNRDYLSQEEIDALLRQSSEDSSVSSFHGPPQVEDYLSPSNKMHLGKLVILHSAVRRQRYRHYLVRK